MGLLPVFTQTVNNDIDILFVIDNSGSMKEEQDNLRRNFPSFTRALKALPQGLPNVHIAVVSSSMGAGRFAGVPGCPVGGDSGIFQSAGRAGNCRGPRDPFISAVGADRNFDGDIDDVLSCIAPLGTNGCGFEQQLLAARTALDPLRMPAQNRGFLREEAVLALVLLTDEDDCSAPVDTNLFDPAQTLVSQPLGPLGSFRCNEFGHLCSGQRPPRARAVELQDCHSAEDGRLLKIGDLVDFFRGLKANPDDVMVAAVTGPATPYSITVEPQPLSRGNVQNVPVMVPSCTSANGSAESGGPYSRFRDRVRRERHLPQHLRRRLHPGDGAHRTGRGPPRQSGVFEGARRGPGSRRPRGAGALSGVRRNDQRRCHPARGDPRLRRRRERSLLARGGLWNLCRVGIAHDRGPRRGPSDRGNAPQRDLRNVRSAGPSALLSSLIDAGTRRTAAAGGSRARQGRTTDI